MPALRSGRSAPSPRPRVCFLYIAQAHQVLHSLSAACELALTRPDIQVDVAATSAEVLDYARLLARLTRPAPIGWRLLGPPWLRELKWFDGLPPKALALIANAPRLARYDVIVAPERTTTLLRRLGVRAKLVYTQHGAGDRAGPFEPRLGRFDLVFAAGAKQRDRMIGEGLVRPERCAVVGYPKFDIVDQLNPVLPKLFPTDRPIVLYNPHFSTTLGSWPDWGLRVLEAFAHQDRYNLVFAPHLRLFGARPAAEVPELAPFRGLPNIHLDTAGSSAAIDMTYTRAAHVYLGDVSSQVYEFIRRPRPCVFLNPHGVAWQGDDSYRHWTFGPVLNSPDGLIDAINAARSHSRRYLAAQQAGFQATFETDDGLASERAASAIAGLLPAVASVTPPLRFARESDAALADGAPA